ncbi:hypothetical protein CK203_026538 [Vitis vinifera]|uniref:Retrotransposon gag domain-containing protein n=1 Tax=Vitis vinifera TaxID=29760 RepID=A0A438IVQ3_VITVI|nr:hypothetical protein CK203_026538 [Vitis vinifera]
MHYRQLMTLDIGNDALLCKVFPPAYKGRLSHEHQHSTKHKNAENESLREFVKRFGQAVLQVEAYSMDVVLQIFKRSICPGTPFFKSLAKKPPTTMDDLFWREQISMLEDDVRAATQQILVAGQASRSGAERSAKLQDRPRPPVKGRKNKAARKAAPHISFHIL